MALSRAMKNLMHQAAQARGRGGRTDTARPGPEAESNWLRDRFAKAHREKIAAQRATPGTGGVVGPAVEPPGPGGRVQIDLGGARVPRGRGTRYDPAEDPARGRGTALGRKPMPRRGTGGVVGPGGGNRDQIAVPGGAAGMGRRRGGTFGFVSRGAGGTPALQQATAGARRQALAQRAAPRAAPGARAPLGVTQQQAAMAASRARGGPLGAGGSRQRLARQVGAREGPPARRGGMPRAFGSRRMLR